MTLVGRVFTNRYEIVRPIAHGGMAEVYLAHDQLLDRPVALKALFPEFARDPSFVERFRREAQAAANLNHPNIVSIYDWGQESGTYFIVMEYVEGRSLRDVMREGGRLEPQRAVRIAADIASALAFAHRNGVVHRDVKPANVLLTHNGDVKVTDFGVARAGTSEALTQTGSVMGTATYFSPEQAQGLAVDGRSDVYSLGVVLYEMVVGAPPFTADTPVAVAYQHVREQPPAPRSLVADIPPDLEQIILTALAKDVHSRYQSADDLRADLLAFERGRPPSAAPVTATVAAATAATTVAAASDAYAQNTIVQPAVRHPNAVYERPRSNTNRIIVLVVTLLVLAGAIAAILAFAKHDGSSPSAGQISVPDVTNKPEAEARQILDRAGLAAAVTYKENSDPQRIGTVVDQDPSHGTFVDKGATVRLDVAGIRVPDVTGLSAADAGAKIKAAGLKVAGKTKTATTDSGFQNGQVVGTSPSGVVGPGQTITLIVSPGPSTSPIPDVHNLSATDAIAALQQAGFTITTTQQEPSDTIKAGLVTRTDPPAGTPAAKDQPITVFVSGGPASVPIPTVKGFTQTAACNALESAGFVCDVTTVVGTPAQVGIVIDQAPVGGTQGAKGDHVQITVGKAGPATTTTTAPTTTTTTAATTTTT